METSMSRHPHTLLHTQREIDVSPPIAWSSPQMLNKLFFMMLWKHRLKMEMQATPPSTNVPAARNKMAACQKPLATSPNVPA